MHSILLLEPEKLERVSAELHEIPVGRD